MKKNIVCIAILPKLNAMVEVKIINNGTYAWVVKELITGKYLSLSKQEDTRGLNSG